MARRAKVLFLYRELVRNLVVSELKGRYKGSVLGFVWTLLNPLGMMLVFTLVFGVLWPNNGIEKYPLFLLCGLLPWNFFQASVMGSTNSIVANGNLVKKVYFPREVLPTSTVLSQLVNFLLAFLVLFGVLLVFRVPFEPVAVVVARRDPDPDLLHIGHRLDSQYAECVLPRHHDDHGSRHAGLVLFDPHLLLCGTVAGNLHVLGCRTRRPPHHLHL